MPKTTKTTRKTTKKPAARATVRVGGTSKKKGSLLGRLLPKKQGQWVLVIVVMAIVGGVGSWMLTTSNAGTTALSKGQCDIRGRAGYFRSDGAYYCKNQNDSYPCQSGAGSYI